MIRWQYYDRSETEVLNCFRNGEVSCDQILERLLRRGCDPRSPTIMNAMIASAQRLQGHFDGRRTEFDYTQLHDGRWEGTRSAILEQMEKERLEREKERLERKKKK